ncbi:hypothetical protein C1H46_000610 [Malus baccata]|uniref:Uncharacterized protein n=1 Tax=Malus baccata TaxID=106549 RepID=A0A540NSI5_MALBA|nr:hypothetical protein C1H46_000610 [Malus baccata]
MGSSGHEKGAMRTPEHKLPTWISASSFGASSSASSCASSSTAYNDVTKSDTGFNHNHRTQFIQPSAADSKQFFDSIPLTLKFKARRFKKRVLKNYLGPHVGWERLLLRYQNDGRDVSRRIPQGF